MPTIASVTDVQNRWWGHEITEDETPLVEQRLGDVERRIRRRIKDLDDRILAGTTDVEDVKQVEADAVLRLVKNPDGFMSETDGNYTYMLSQDSTSGKLEILPDEWALLGWTQRRMVTMVPTFEMPR
jgi:uncharacterized protein YcaQ